MAYICKHNGCEKKSSSNFPGQKAMYCTTHKLSGMVNVKSRMCNHEGCCKDPSFALPGQKRMYCLAHKLDKMIYVKSHMCVNEGCNKRPSCAFPGQKAMYCSTHKKIGMVNVISNRCIHEGCNIIPYFNFPGEKPLYCSRHKLDNMDNVKDKRCKQEGCVTIVKQYRKHLKGYCLRCFIYNFPDEKVARGYKVKEKHVTDALKPVLYDLGVEPVFDKRIGGNWLVEDCCQTSLRRPDVLIDMGTHSIIIEIDENQHDNYSCENKRTMEIFKDLGMRPMVFIRFNPDDYIDESNEKVKSCFKYHKSTGVLFLDCSMKKYWDMRIKMLQDILKKYIKNAQNGIIPMKEITYELLFYDGYKH